jgi:hypothetical protein
MAVEGTTTGADLSEVEKVLQSLDIPVQKLAAELVTDGANT